MQGISHRRSQADFHVIRVHYSADPEKDPATTEGKQWLESESKGYPGGMGSQKWRQEMEIDWEAMGGELVFPFLEIYERKIVSAPFEVPESWALYGSFDYGHRNPSAFAVNAVDHDSNVWTVWEYYKAGVGYRETAKAIRGCPYFNRLASPPIADPSIWAQTQQSADNEVKSMAQLFMELPEDEQVFFAKAKSGGDITAAEKIKGFLWKNLDNEEPRWKIFAGCRWMLWELRRLRYADWSEGIAPRKNTQESIIDKDNHLWDCQKQFFTQFFASPESPTQRDPHLEALKREDPLSYRETQYIRNWKKPGTGNQLLELLKD